MRLAQGWAGIRRRSYLGFRLCSFIPGQVRVQYILLTRNARQLPLPLIPGENRYESRAVMNPVPLLQKSPSAATNKGRTVNKKLSQTPAPASTLSISGSLFFHPPVAAEGRFESYFANSKPYIAIGHPGVNGLSAINFNILRSAAFPTVSPAGRAPVSL